MKEYRCSRCGANIKIKEGAVADKCEYCGSLLDVKNEKLNNGKDLNNIPQRPEFSFAIFILLMFFGVVFAVVYYILVHYKQKEWDQMYGHLKK